MKNRLPRYVLIIFLITLFGIINIYSTTTNNPNSFAGRFYLRQIIWFIVAGVCFMGFAHIPYRRLQETAIVFYISGIILLLAVVFSGLVRLGAQRWLRILWFNFQPSEFMKLVIIIFLAYYFSKKSMSLRPDVWRWDFMHAVLLPLACVSLPIILILKQPDLGTGLFIFFLFICMLFLAQVRLKYIIAILLILVLFCPFAWHMLKDYQKIPRLMQQKQGALRIRVM